MKRRVDRLGGGRVIFSRVRRREAENSATGRTFAEKNSFFGEIQQSNRARVK
jgi:hypothetical protein